MLNVRLHIVGWRWCCISDIFKESGKCIYMHGAGYTIDWHHWITVFRYINERICIPDPHQLIMPSLASSMIVKCQVILFIAFEWTKKRSLLIISLTIVSDAIRQTTVHRLGPRTLIEFNLCWKLNFLFSPDLDDESIHRGSNPLNPHCYESWS